jgi:hypothetical protein
LSIQRVVWKNLKEWMVFMKEPAKNWWFFGQFIDCLNNLRTTIIHQNHLFENFENWQVSGYIHGLITDGHLSRILRTAQHWLAPPASLKCGK